MKSKNNKQINLKNNKDIDIFKNNINIYLNKEKQLPKEIIDIANFVNNNPHIIENIIETSNPLRCIACCYNKQQCSKNKKDNNLFCGIHIKKRRYGTISQISDNIVNIDVTLTDIKGVLCYVDEFYNVYQAEDVIQNKINPKIIAKWDGKNYNVI